MISIAANALPTIDPEQIISIILRRYAAPARLGTLWSAIAAAPGLAVDSSASGWPGDRLEEGRPVHVDGSAVEPGILDDWAARVIDCIAGTLAASPSRRQAFDNWFGLQIQRATASAQFVERFHGGPIARRRAFVAGLLHSVGEWAVTDCFPKASDRVQRELRLSPASRLAIEQQVYGVDHRGVTDRILLAWNVPAIIRAAIHDARAVHAVEMDGRPAALLVAGLRHAADNANHVVPVDDSRSQHLTGRHQQRMEVRTVGSPPHGNDAPINVAAQLAQLAVAADSLAGWCADLAAWLANHLGADPVVVFTCPGADQRMQVAVAEGGQVRTLHVHTDQLLALRDDRTVTEAWIAAAAPDELTVLADALRVHLARRVQASCPALSPLRCGGAVEGGVLIPVTGDRHGLTPDDDLLDLLAALTHQVRRRDELQRHNQQVRADHGAVTERQEQDCRHALINEFALMAAGAAHELNTPLAVIAGRAQMLLKDVEDPDVKRQLTTIDAGARRVGNLLAEWLRYAKPAAPQPRDHRAIDWCDQLHQHCQRRHGLSPEQLHINLADPQAHLHADLDQVTTALAAIIENAVAASKPENMCLEINLAPRASDDTLVVSVGDHGAGMAPEVAQHACTPFFSDRPAGRRRGWGLAHAARLIDLNHGRLWISSTPGVGTTVSVSLPTRRPG